MSIRKQLQKFLDEIGVKKDAIADKFASVDGTPAILLHWDGQEEYYTGFGRRGDEPQPEYENWLVRIFG